MKRKIFSLILVLVMVFICSGCNNDISESSSDISSTLNQTSIGISNQSSSSTTESTQSSIGGGFDWGKASISLYSPIKNGICNAINPEFKWSKSNSAESYTFYLEKSNGNSFTQIEKKTGIKGESYTLKKNLENGVTYRWRVEGIKSDGTVIEADEKEGILFMAFNASEFVKNLSTTIPDEIEADLNGGFSPKNSVTCDYWFIEKDGKYHTFFLHRPLSKPESYMDIGHAVSDDLENWKYYGTVLEPEKKKWDDVKLATGSVVEKDGIYYMVYTGHSSVESGIGISVSKDLYNWTKVGNSFIISSNYAYKVDGMSVTVGCDPYIYPEKINGYYYMVANSFVQDYGENNGCLLMLKSKDLLYWEAHKVILKPQGFKRMETPQLFENNGKWYMYFGGVTSSKTSLEKGICNSNESIGEYTTNYMYISDSFDGEYVKKDWSVLSLPDKESFYICKTVVFKDKSTKLLAHHWGLWKLMGPYNVKYSNDGKFEILK